MSTRGRYVAVCLVQRLGMCSTRHVVILAVLDEFFLWKNDISRVRMRS